MNREILTKNSIRNILMVSKIWPGQDFFYDEAQRFLPNTNFLHLTISEIWPEQDFSTSSSLQQGERLNQGQTMMLHNYAP